MAGEQVLHARGGSLAVRGRVLLDGAPASRASMAALRRAAGFVAQDDQLLPTLTVRESVAFSAALRLPSYDDAAVDAVIARAGLAHVAHNRVGGANAARGVSGGERRRVSIAQELVTNPPLLFLDEPTSGLDAFTAASLVDTLARLASEGHAVVAAVHQPSAEVFGAFSSVVLLSQGRALWRGAPAALDATLHAASAPCPHGRNPADHLLQLASAEADADALARAAGEVDTSNDTDDSGELSARSAASADELPVRRVSVMAAAAVPAPNAADSGASAAAAKPATAAAPAGVLACARRELRTLAWREALHYARSPTLLLTHLAVALLLSVWIGVIYFHGARSCDALLAQRIAADSRLFPPFSQSLRILLGSKIAPAPPSSRSPPSASARCPRWSSSSATGRSSPRSGIGIMAHLPISRSKPPSTPCACASSRAPCMVLSSTS
jgi:ABC-type multidrug transport system ATPase subunit